MHCNHAQLEVSIQDSLTDGAARHLATCVACDEFDRFQRLITTEARAWRDEAPSVTLRTRIENRLADRQSARRSAVPLGWRALALGAGLTAVVGGVLFFGVPRSAEAAYQVMLLRVSRVATVHYTLYGRRSAASEGPLVKIDELWYKHGAWREKSSPDRGGDRLKLQAAEGLTYSHFDPTQGKVVTMQESAEQVSKFSVREIAEQFLGAPGHYDVRNIDPAAEEITVSSADGWSRVRFLVDPATELPSAGDKQFFSRSAGWVTSAHFEVEFNMPIPARVFDPADLEPKP